MLGCSVFDFYHIDDMRQLKEVYESIIKERGTSFRSKPYRFRVHNGCYVMFDTEWSCVINPWSYKLEYVVGHHRILKGPTDINIFTPCDTISSEEVIEERQVIQEEIETILSKSLEKFDFKKNKRLGKKRKRDSTSSVNNCIDEKGETLDVLADAGTKSGSNCAVRDDPSDYFKRDDLFVALSPSAKQIRYPENIDRYFASLYETHSGASEDYNENENISSVEGYQGTSTCSENGSYSENCFAMPNLFYSFRPCIQAPSTEALVNLCPANPTCNFLPVLMTPSFPQPIFLAFHGTSNCNHGIPHGVRVSGVTTTSPSNVTATTAPSGMCTVSKDFKEICNDDEKNEKI